MDEESAMNGLVGPSGTSTQTQPARYPNPPKPPKVPKPSQTVSTDQGQTAKPPKQQHQQQKGKKNAKSALSTDRPPTLTHRDLFHRVNFTYQASAFLAHLASGQSRDVCQGQGQAGAEAGPSGSDHHDDDEEMDLNEDSGVGQAAESVERKGKGRATSKCSEGKRDAGVVLERLAKRGMKENKRMVAHNLLKLDPSLKRAICKKCCTVLIPGLTSRIRNRPNPVHMHKTHQSCLSCHTSRSIPIPPLSSYLSDPPPILDPTIAEKPTRASVGLNPEGRRSDTIDGPVRKRQMLRAAKRGTVPFHLREAPAPFPGADSGPAGVQSVQGKEGGMGHTLWAADQRVSGWGIIEHGRGKAEGSKQGTKDGPAGSVNGTSETRSQAVKTKGRAGQAAGPVAEATTPKALEPPGQDPPVSSSAESESISRSESTLQIPTNSTTSTFGSAAASPSSQTMAAPDDEADEEAMWNM